MDANKILGVLLQSGMARSGTSRAQRLAGSGQGGGGLASIAGALLGGGSQRGGGIADIAGALLGGGSQRGGGGIADIAGALLGGGRSDRASAGVAASGGAMAILSSLAGVAMQQFGSAQGSPGLAEEAAPYDAAADPDSRATVMIRAMITAAKADGEIDAQEKQRILGRLEEAGADPGARAFVQAEMAKPVDLDAIVSAVNSPQMAVEAYTASLFAIDVDTPAEADYMRQLAMSLRLDPVLVRSLHQSLEPAA